MGVIHFILGSIYLNDGLTSDTELDLRARGCQRDEARTVAPDTADNKREF